MPGLITENLKSRLIHKLHGIRLAIHIFYYRDLRAVVKRQALESSSKSLSVSVTPLLNQEVKVCTTATKTSKDSRGLSTLSPNSITSLNHNTFGESTKRTRTTRIILDSSLPLRLQSRVNTMKNKSI